MTEQDVKQVQTLRNAERVSSGVLKPVSEEKKTEPAPKPDAAAPKIESVLTPPPIKKSSDIIEDQAETSKAQNIFQTLFANNNKVLTAEDGDLNINSETRRMLVLFSDGTYLIDEAHRFDGQVLNFTAIAKRRKLIIHTPKYVSSQEIAAIYAYATRGSGEIKMSAQESADYQMQIDFLSVVNRAAAKKVSDVHVVVADSTLILFRVNGMMERELEYSAEWGESFVRAAFASADISDANYAQNEFQGYGL